MITAEELDNFLKEKGKRGIAIINTLGKLQDFKDAYETTIGQELLKDMMDKFAAIHYKLTHLSESQEERAEYKVLYETLLSWSVKINTYNRGVEQIKKGE